RTPRKLAGGSLALPCRRGFRRGRRRVEGRCLETLTGKNGVSVAGRMAKVIKAHITGTVWKIEVKLGEPVSEGTVVAILESMKMEMPVESEDDGTVESIHVKEGQPVTEGDPLVTLA